MAVCAGSSCVPALQEPARGATLPNLQATLVEKIAAQVFTEQDKARGAGGSGGEYTTQPDTSPDTSPVSSPEPSFRPRLPTYFLSLRQGTRIGNEDFSLNSLREARGVEEFFSTSPQQRRLQDSDSDNRFPSRNIFASFA